MKIEIEKANLVTAVAMVAPVASGKSTLPILSHVALKIIDNVLEIEATDLEIGIKTTCECMIQEPGEITLPAKKLLEIVRSLPDGVTVIETEENSRVGISSGDCSFKLYGMPASDYPETNFSECPNGPIEARLVVSAISKAIFAAATDESRFNLNGVLCEINDGTAKLTCTDGHRLAQTITNWEIGDDAKILIPKKQALEMLRVVKGLKNHDQVYLGFSDKNIFIDTGAAVMSIRLIDGDYPPYEKVIPRPSDRAVTLDRVACVKSLKRVAIMAEETNRSVELRISPKTITFIVAAPNVGDGQDSMYIDYSGDEFSVCVNIYYLLEALNSNSGETITMDFQPEYGAIVIRDIEDDSYFSLVMPMRR